MNLLSAMLFLVGRYCKHYSKSTLCIHHHHHSSSPMMMMMILSKQHCRPSTLSASTKVIVQRNNNYHRFYHQSPDDNLSDNGSHHQSIPDTTSSSSLYSYSFPIYYNDVYEVNLPLGHRFPMWKYRRVRESIQEKVLSARKNDQSCRVQCDFRVSPLATREQLLTTHDAQYIHRYLHGEMTESENRNIGFPWSHQHVNRTLSSVGGTVAAACAAWDEYARRYIIDDDVTTNRRSIFWNERNKHLCWAAHTAGGTHHAFKDYGEGFCIFSDIAVAANVLLEKCSQSSSVHNSFPCIRRILIIDLDVHQGNGNAALFQNNKRVQTFSMHCSGNYFSRKEVSDLDVEVPVGCTDETYLSTLQYWLKRIEQHNFTDSMDSHVPSTSAMKRNFDFIFFQAGVDIHEDDRLGRLRITAEGISRRNSIVFDFANRQKCPLVITLGGGYPNGKEGSSIVEAHTQVYCDAHDYLTAAYS